MKITCDVIKDLAELYVGNALSEDSKNIVEAHIIDCPRCKEYIEMSRKAFEEPPLVDVAKIAEEKAELKSLKDKILGMILPTVMMTIVVLTIVFVSINYVLFEHEVLIPYDGKMIYVTEDGFLHLPDCYDVTFILSNSENVRIEVHTHYIDKLRGLELDEEKIVDLKEVVNEYDEAKLLYRDGTSEQVVWEKQ